MLCIPVMIFQNLPYSAVLYRRAACCRTRARPDLLLGALAVYAPCRFFLEHAGISDSTHATWAWWYNTMNRTPTSTKLRPIRCARARCAGDLPPAACRARSPGTSFAAVPLHAGTTRKQHRYFQHAHPPSTTALARVLCGNRIAGRYRTLPYLLPPTPLRVYRCSQRQPLLPCAESRCTRLRYRRLPLCASLVPQRTRAEP